MFTIRLFLFIIYQRLQSGTVRAMFAVSWLMGRDVPMRTAHALGLFFYHQFTRQFLVVAATYASLPRRSVSPGAWKSPRLMKAECELLTRRREYTANLVALHELLERRGTWHERALCRAIYGNVEAIKQRSSR